MKIVMDTDALITAVFFGGQALQAIEAVMRGRAAAYATREIVAEYEAVVAGMKGGAEESLRPSLLLPFVARLHIVEPKPKTASGDDKFLACAMAANALYVVGEGKEAAPTGPYRSVKVVTVEALCQLLELCA